MWVVRPGGPPGPPGRSDQPMVGWDRRCETGAATCRSTRSGRSGSPGRCRRPPGCCRGNHVETPRRRSSTASAEHCARIVRHRPPGRPVRRHVRCGRVLPPSKPAGSTDSGAAAGPFVASGTQRYARGEHHAKPATPRPHHPRRRTGRHGQHPAANANRHTTPRNVPPTRTPRPARRQPPRRNATNRRGGKQRRHEHHGRTEPPRTGRRRTRTAGRTTTRRRRERW